MAVARSNMRTSSRHGATGMASSATLPSPACGNTPAKANAREIYPHGFDRGAGLAPMHRMHGFGRHGRLDLKRGTESASHPPSEEERRVGHSGVPTCSIRWATAHENNKT